MATGTTLKIIADAVAGDRTVVGFDVLHRLARDLAHRFPGGRIRAGIPDVPGAEVVAGLFEDTLPGFLARNEEPVAFVHVDCDLYSSTKTVLDLVGDRLAPDAVLVFDEFFNYPGLAAARVPGLDRFVERDRPHLRIPRPTPATTNRSSCGCTDQLSYRRAQLSRLISSGSASRYCSCSAGASVRNRRSAFVIRLVSVRQLLLVAASDPDTRLRRVGDDGVVEKRDVPPLVVRRR